MSALTAQENSPAPFPLPVTPFEYYYLSDDRPQYPTTFPIELTFDGALDRDRLTTALAEAVRRHPMLRASIDDSMVRPSWVACRQPSPWLDWSDGSAPIAHPSGQGIDLRRESGLRTWVHAGDRATTILQQFHHACCDGLAAFQFIEDWLLCYSAARDGTSSNGNLVDLDCAKLKERGDFREPGSTKLSRWAALRSAGGAARHWSKALFRKPALLHVEPPPAECSAPAGSNRQFAVGILHTDQIDSLKRIAGSLDATLNDLLLRDLLLAISNWNAARPPVSNARMWLNVPVNLRRRSDRAMPAANRIGFAFVSLAPMQCRDRSGALRSIHDQMARIRKQGEALLFLQGLAFACPIPGLVPWALGRNRSFATMVHSNLGKVFGRAKIPRREGRLVCGDACLTRVAAVPPIRPLTRGAIAVMEYANEMTISLRCDPSLFSVDQTQSLLDAYMGQLAKTMRLAT